MATGSKTRVAIGLVKEIGPKKADASREADRQKTARNHKPITTLSGQTEDVWSTLSALYPERAEDRPIEFCPPERISHDRDLRATSLQAHHSPLGKPCALGNQVDRGREMVPRIEKSEIRREKVKPLADPTVDKIRRIMHLVYKHGQRHEFLPRQQEGNPMNWVSQRTTSDYTAVPMTPKQAFEILLNIPEPRRTLTLSDAATALRVSELLALMWMDLDFANLVMYVRRAYVWGQVQGAEIQGIEGPSSHTSSSGRVSFGLARKDAFLRRTRTSCSQASGSRARSRCPRPSWCRSTSDRRR